MIDDFSHLLLSFIRSVVSFVELADAVDDGALDSVEAVVEGGELREDETDVVASFDTVHLQILLERAFDVVPAVLFVGSDDAHQLLELQHVCFLIRRQRLRIALVARQDQRFEFIVVHDRDDFLGDTIHVSIRALQLERRLCAILVGLSRRVDVLAIDLQDHVPGSHQLLHHGNHLVQLFE